METSPDNNTDTSAAQPETEASSEEKCYSIQFRRNEQIYSAVSRVLNLKKKEVVMAQTDHGLEPAEIKGPACQCPCRDKQTPKASYTLIRRGTREEIEKYARLVEREKEAFDLCQRYIEKHGLPMKLIKVERFFNGSKIIFYFTAETRVDFRELVKDLVQEFRTRVEIRQIGVRHETKMIGGIGCCGRELCCSSFIKTFSPVSIKMAKEQDLPLNPSKISGICNRLLCCLTYEFDTYHRIRKNMPKMGKTITLDGQKFKVLKHHVLEESIEVVSLDDPENRLSLVREDWQRAKVMTGPKGRPSSTQKGKPRKKKNAPQGEKK